MFNTNYELTWETVAVALRKGLNLRSRARLVEPDQLLVADNVMFDRDGGPQKRNGHRGKRLRVSGAFPPAVNRLDTRTLSYGRYEAKTLPPTWLAGFGKFVNTQDTTVADAALTAVSTWIQEQ